MVIIKFSVNAQHLKIDTDLRHLAPVSDTYNYFKCQFTFDSSWDGFDKRIYFKNASFNITKSAILDASGYCYIPWELLAHPGVILCSVTGIKYSNGVAERLTADPVYVFLQKSEGILEPDFQPDPSLTEYEQFLADVKSYRDEIYILAEEIRSTVENLSYNTLLNRPSIEDVILEGNKTFADLNLVNITDSDLDDLLV